MKKVAPYLCLLMFLIILPSYANSFFSSGAKEPTLVVFGDDYSDQDGSYHLSLSMGLPRISFLDLYYNHSYSNGPGWTAYVSKMRKFKDVLNYAVGGATAGTVNKNDSRGFPLGGLVQQIDRYQRLNPNSKISPEAIVVLQFGVNDLLVKLSEGFNSNTLSLASEELLKNISKGIERLLKLGARKVIIWNIMDISKMPLAMFLESQYPGFTVSVSEAIKSYNKKLLGLVNKINENSPEVQKIYSFDFNRIFSETLNQLATDGVDVKNYTYYIEESAFPDVAIPTGFSAENLVFQDQLHFTTLFWSAFSKKFVNYMDSMGFSLMGKELGI